MASSDYVAPFKGNDYTLTAQAAVTAGQLVKVVADGQVAPATAATDAWIGVATMNAGIGQPVGITSGGVQAPVAAGAIAAGDPVIAGAAGKVAKGASATAAGLVGIAVTGAADGAAVKVKFSR